ncbi:MAG: hypothetical protein VX770_03890 [Candidatus Neomarinimicrobiota bacterium]|jgi:hypothetical protein|nr:hypothetical protein [Candidatus Neomarinimicrobiota bacterium]|tara:strand:- start:39 stop:221 length:183 start_codon:yes stop_codon:yes gene_type:complete
MSKKDMIKEQKNNYTNKNTSNKKILAKFILNDENWVQAFLQAQLDMKEFINESKVSMVAS